MPSAEFEAFLRELRAAPCENPNQIGHAALRAIQDARVPEDAMPCPELQRESCTLDGVPCEWLRVPHAPQQKAVVYLHGGGWSLGSLKATRQFLAPMVRRIGIHTVSVGYRLMPEHPFPAGLDDCRTAWLAVLRQGFAPAQTALVGESAGGNLALALALRLRDEGLPLPGAIAVMSPVTYVDSLEGTHTSLKPLERVLADDSFLVTRAARLYAPDTDPRHPYLSPLYGSLSGLPPLLLTVGTDEILFDDTIRFYQKARLSGVDATLLVGDHMTHSWPIFSDRFPEAAQAVDAIGRFLHARLDGTVSAQSD